MAKKKKKRVFKIKNIIILLCIIISIGVLFYFGITMPVDNIYISGNDIVSDEEILSLSGLSDYPSFFLVSKNNIRDALLENEFIEDVVIRKSFGNIIELEIKEYSVIGIDLEDRVILSDGKRVDNKYSLGDFPRIISTDMSDDIYDSFVSKFSEIDSDILRSVSEIEYSPVSVDYDRFLLYMSDGNLVYVTLTKINKFNKYNDIKDVLEGKKGIIYLDSGDYVELKG